MAREKMVTRTVTQTEVTLLCVRLSEQKLEHLTTVLPGTYKDEDALLKASKKAVEGDDIKVVSVCEASLKETLYGMPEKDFIASAQILPDRTKKEKEN